VRRRHNSWLPDETRASCQDDMPVWSVAENHARTGKAANRDVRLGPNPPRQCAEIGPVIAAPETKFDISQVCHDEGFGLEQGRATHIAIAPRLTERQDQRREG